MYEFGKWVYVVPLGGLPCMPLFTDPLSDSASSYCDGRMTDPSSESQSSYSLSRSSSTVKLAFRKDMICAFVRAGGDEEMWSVGEEESDRGMGKLVDLVDEWSEEAGEEVRGDNSVGFA